MAHTMRVLRETLGPRWRRWLLGSTFVLGHLSLYVQDSHGFSVLVRETMLLLAYAILVLVMLLIWISEDLRTIRAQRAWREQKGR